MIFEVILLYIISAFFCSVSLFTAAVLGLNNTPWSLFTLLL